MTGSGNIDAVITWVDGDDPSHERKRLACLNKERMATNAVLAAGTDNIRFKNNGELLYCLASIKKYAPWINTIHLVTDEQKPCFLTSEVVDNYRINLVDHTQLFFQHEKVLPTFNSRTLETALFRIPGLAEQFIYFNDDFLLLQKVQPQDFFIDDKVVLHGSWKKLQNIGNIYLLKNRILNFTAKKIFGITRTMHLLAQMRGAQLGGFEKSYFRSMHAPHPMIKKTLENHYLEHPDAFLANVRFKFRSVEQHWPVSLANHLEITKRKAILRDGNDIYMINGERQSKGQIKKIINAVTQNQATFLCLQSMEKIPHPVRLELDRVLRKKLDFDKEYFEL